MLVTTPDRPPLPAASSDPQSLVDSLLYSVSHDLRSPLLTLALSADLLEDVLGEAARAEGESSAGVALDALRHGARDLERMLHALAQVSRARRRPLGAPRGRMQLVLAGHIVLSDDSDLGSRVLGVDPLAVRELLDWFAADEPLRIRVSTVEGFAVLDVTLPEPTSIDGSPLAALCESLQAHAGTAVERLAVAEVLLQRQGAALAPTKDGVRLWLPIAGLA